MTLSHQVAKHLREVHFGGTWTAADLRGKLDGVTWVQATTQVASFHTIACLVYHINYYIHAAIEVLEGGPYRGDDAESFDCPPIASSEDWERLKGESWRDAERLACLIEELPDEKLKAFFVDEQSGTNFRCLHGRVEHAYYHLGQISMIKSLLAGELPA
ncbi:MAG: DUF1572 domain-containing protein [Planctomycetota bacterium]